MNRLPSKRPCDQKQRLTLVPVAPFFATRVAAPFTKCCDRRVASFAAAPNGIVDIESDFVVTFVHAIGLATKVGHVGNPHYSV